MSLAGSQSSFDARSCTISSRQSTRSWTAIGRIGRLLIGLMLINERRLTSPLLYISGYLETHRREYYDRLEAVREMATSSLTFNFSSLP